VRATEAVQASSGLPTAAKLAGTVIAVGGMRVAHRHSAGASAKAVAMHAAGIAINGYGRSGRQVARVATRDPEVELKLINASYNAEYLAYLVRLHSRPPR